MAGKKQSLGLLPHVGFKTMAHRAFRDEVWFPSSSRSVVQKRAAGTQQALVTSKGGREREGGSSQ